MAPGYSTLNLRATPGRLPEPTGIVNKYYNLFGLTPLWPRAGGLLTAEKLSAWESQIETSRARGAGPATRSGLTDQGTDVGLDAPAPDNAPFAALTGQAFVKFFGAGHNRVERDLRVCLNNHFLPIGVVVEWAVG